MAYVPYSESEPACTMAGRVLLARSPTSPIYPFLLSENGMLDLSLLRQTFPGATGAQYTTREGLLVTVPTVTCRGGLTMLWMAGLGGWSGPLGPPKGPSAFFLVTCGGGVELSDESEGGRVGSDEEKTEEVLRKMVDNEIQKLGSELRDGMGFLSSSVGEVARQHEEVRSTCRGREVEAQRWRKEVDEDRREVMEKFIGLRGQVADLSRGITQCIGATMRIFEKLLQKKNLS